MARLVQDVDRAERDLLPDEVARAAAEAGLGAHEDTWLPQFPWWPAAYLFLPGVPAARMIAWLVETGARAPFWLVAVQLAGAALFSAVSARLAWKIVDPRWRRRRVFGFAGGLVLRDEAGWLFTVRWDEIARYGRVLRPDGSPGPSYEIGIREGRDWRLVVDDFRPGHVEALDRFVRRHRMAQRVRRPAEVGSRSTWLAREAAAPRARLAAEAQRLPAWARRV